MGREYKIGGKLKATKDLDKFLQGHENRRAKSEGGGLLYRVRSSKRQHQYRGSDDWIYDSDDSCTDNCTITAMEQPAADRVYAIGEELETREDMYVFLAGHKKRRAKRDQGGHDFSYRAMGGRLMSRRPGACYKLSMAPDDLAGCPAIISRLEPGHGEVKVFDMPGYRPRHFNCRCTDVEIVPDSMDILEAMRWTKEHPGREARRVSESGHRWPLHFDEHRGVWIWTRGGRVVSLYNIYNHHQAGRRFTIVPEQPKEEPNPAPLPCPFCGGSDLSCLAAGNLDMQYGCNQCNARGPTAQGKGRSGIEWNEAKR